MIKRAVQVLGVGVSAAVCGGCAVYTVAGQFEGSGRAFLGEVTVSVTDSGTLKVQSEDGLLQCTGDTQVTKRGSLMSNVGAQGRGQATCNDGRTFKVDFVQTSESGGHGQGIDSQGNIVVLFFDTSETAARARLDQARLDALVQ